MPPHLGHLQAPIQSRGRLRQDWRAWLRLGRPRAQCLGRYWQRLERLTPALRDFAHAHLGLAGLNWGLRQAGRRSRGLPRATRILSLAERSHLRWRVRPQARRHSARVLLPSWRRGHWNWRSPQGRYSGREPWPSSPQGQSKGLSLNYGQNSPEHPATAASGPWLRPGLTNSGPKSHDLQKLAAHWPSGQNLELHDRPERHVLRRA